MPLRIHHSIIPVFQYSNCERSELSSFIPYIFPHFCFSSSLSSSEAPPQAMEENAPPLVGLRQSFASRFHEAYNILPFATMMRFELPQNKDGRLLSYSRVSEHL
jgi:hypothetical protein